MRVVLLTLLVAVPALAQKEELFGTGKPPTFREEAMDKKFAKTQFAKALTSGTDDPACVQLLGGMFVALAEIMPTVHKRDENFSLDPSLIQAVDTQLSTARFPAMAYLVSMVRRVMIEKRVPDEWLETAKKLNTKVKIIDLAQLKMANEGLAPVDSFGFTIGKLKERYAAEALAANSAVTTDVVATFRDSYLDRDVAWGGATLIDARPASFFLGKEKAPNAAAYGHIPGALSLDSASYYDDKTNRLKPKAELAALSAHVPAGPAVSYCNTGHWAATDWFVLHELLGREDVRLYDGSMVEWTANPNRPVESARTKWDDLKKKLGLGS